MRNEFLQSVLPQLERIALANFRKPALEAQNKAENGFDPVTNADRGIELAFRKAVHDAFPDDGILGEEQAERLGASGYQWIIDPIDGTRAFIIGAPVFTILIALQSAHGDDLAVISQPFTGERFWAKSGEAFWQRGDARLPLKVSGVTDLAQAKLASTFPEIGTDAEKRAFDQVATQVRLTRYGLDAYAFALLAMGQIDLVLEAGLYPFDYAAPRAVIEAAGGFVTNWQGDAPNGRSTIIAAATRELLDATIAQLNP